MRAEVAVMLEYGEVNQTLLPKKSLAFITGFEKIWQIRNVKAKLY